MLRVGLCDWTCLLRLWLMLLQRGLEMLLWLLIRFGIFDTVECSIYSDECGVVCTADALVKDAMVWMVMVWGCAWASIEATSVSWGEGAFKGDVSVAVCTVGT